MEEEKTWALVSELGGEFGYLEELSDILKQHFHLVSHRDLLRNPALYGPKIQVLLIWKYFPAAEPSLLRLLPSLKVVASGGVGIDHLDVPFINSLGVKVANTPGVVSNASADLAMGLLLASARKVLEGEIVRTTCSPLPCGEFSCVLRLTAHMSSALCGYINIRASIYCLTGV